MMPYALFFVSFLLTTTTTKVAVAQGSGTADTIIFSYYESLIQELEGGRGPSRWSDLQIFAGTDSEEDINQCGGSGQKTGFGQSPVAIPKATQDTCDTNLRGFLFSGGDCNWDQLRFQILNNGVSIEPKLSDPENDDEESEGGQPIPVCTLGRMRIVPSDEEPKEEGETTWEEGQDLEDEKDQDFFYAAHKIIIRASSEHAVDGKFYANELQVLHHEQGAEDWHSVDAAFSILIESGLKSMVECPAASEGSPDTDSSNHETFEFLLAAWEAEALKVDQFCIENPDGTQEFTPDSILRSKQLKIVCPGVGESTTEAPTSFAVTSSPTFAPTTMAEFMLSTNSTDMDELMLSTNSTANSTETIVSNETASFYEAPCCSHDVQEWEDLLGEIVCPGGSCCEICGPPNTLSVILATINSNRTMPNVYLDLGNVRPVAALMDTGANFASEATAGIYSYRGGLTQPPCTESVHWSIVDTPMYISQSQLDRLNTLILCYTAMSTCKRATIASEIGTTSRPLQPLLGREFLHRCPNGPEVGEIGVPIPPVIQSNMDDPLVEESDVVDAITEEVVVTYEYQAVLYPFFILALGVVVYFVVNRYTPLLPYTAVMFSVGMVMGICITVWEENDELSTSTRMWSNINSDVLLLVFLPGLLFPNSFLINFHLFQKSFRQTFVLGVPMVLAGTTLLALVGYLIFDYDWSFYFAMTFGAILSSTDTAAIASLLEEVGAPPRLQLLISGESLMNDGTAIVFFTIFSELFFYELGIPGLGRDIGVGDGILMFIRLSLGSMGFGVGFGLAQLLLLYALKRRFNAKESIVQVSVTVATAYLTYYVADVVGGTSGVVAVATLGLLTSAFGANVINDPVMMEKFWVLVKYLLNTVLFALGGVVWGTVISNNDETRSQIFVAKDWGLLFALYGLMILIRAGLLVTVYPWISKNGLGTNWSEVAFMSWGGLRGAMGIALSLSLDAVITEKTLPGDPRRNFTSQLFFFSGGVALLTLVLNGTSARPILKFLGLTDAGATRAIIVNRYRYTLTHRILEALLHHLGDARFSGVDYGVVRAHISFLSIVSIKELKVAVRRNKENTPLHIYRRPNLESLEPFFGIDVVKDLTKEAHVSFRDRLMSMVTSAVQVMPAEFSIGPAEAGSEPDRRLLRELRQLFIELLRSAYKELVNTGQLNSREGLNVFVLNRSVEMAVDRIDGGDPLCDWEICEEISEPFGKGVQGLYIADEKKFDSNMDITSDFHKTASTVQRAAAFIEAHQIARRQFKAEFCSGNALSPTERALFEESFAQVTRAEAVVATLNKSDVDKIVSHLLCSILLNSAANYIGDLIRSGLLREQEAEEYLDEIEKQLEGLEGCAETNGCMDLTYTDKAQSIRKGQSKEKVEEPAFLVGATEQEVIVTEEPVKAVAGEYTSRVDV